MGFSQEVRYKIGGDTSSLERSFNKVPAIAEAAGRKTEQAFNRGRRSVGSDNLSRSDQKRLDAEYASAARRVKAEKELSDFRKRTAYQEADTAGRIKIVTGDLARLAQTRSKFEQGSVQWMKLQLQMEERMAQLRQLRETRNAELRQGNQGKIGVPGAFTGIEVLRGIGGVIAGMLASALGNQQMKIRMAQAQEESTAVSAASLRERFGQIGGLAGRLRQGRASERDLERLQSFEQGRLEDLVGGRDALLKRNPNATGGEIAMANIRQAISNLTPQGQNIAEQQFGRVQQLNAQLQQQHDENAILERDYQRQRAILGAQLGRGTSFGGGAGVGANGTRDIGSVNVGPERGSVVELERALKTSSMNTLKLAEIEQRRLSKEVEAERKFGTPEAAQAAEIARRTQGIQVGSARLETAQRLIDVRTDLTNKVASGAGVDELGRPRGKSEIERLADRAANRRALANEILVTNPRGEHFGPNGEGRPTSAWDDKYGPELEARRKRITPIYLPGIGVVSQADLEKSGSARTGSVGNLINQARRDEAEVANRLGIGSKAIPGVATSDASGIRAELTTANQLLTAITRALDGEVPAAPAAKK